MDASKSPNGASVVCTHRELKREDVVCVLYGASLPVVPRKRHGRVVLERGMHMFKRVMKGHTATAQQSYSAGDRLYGGPKQSLMRRLLHCITGDKFSNELWTLSWPEGVVRP